MRPVLLWFLGAILAAENPEQAATGDIAISEAAAGEHSLPGSADRQPPFDSLFDSLVDSLVDSASSQFPEQPERFVTAQDLVDSRRGSSVPSGLPLLAVAAWSTHSAKRAQLKRLVCIVLMSSNSVNMLFEVLKRFSQLFSPWSLLHTKLVELLASFAAQFLGYLEESEEIGSLDGKNSVLPSPYAASSLLRVILVHVLVAAGNFIGGHLQ